MKELRDKNVNELKDELLALLKERFNLKMQKGAGQPIKSHLLNQVKLKIARIKTVIHEKGSAS